MRRVFLFFLFVIAFSVIASLARCNTNDHVDLEQEEKVAKELHQLSDKLWEKINTLNIDSSIEVTVDTVRQKLKLRVNHISKEDKKTLKDEFGKTLEIKVSRFWKASPT